MISKQEFISELSDARYKEEETCPYILLAIEKWYVPFWNELWEGRVKYE